MRFLNLWKGKFLFPGKIVVSVCVGFGLVCISSAWATEPPRPGEIQKLKKEGLFEGRLEFVKQTGNDRFSSDLVGRFKQKILGLQGMQIQAIPPNWAGLPTTGTDRIFALLIEFQDYTHTVAETTIDDMLFDDGSPANAPRNSLRDWYDRSSYGLLDLGAGTTFGWYQTAYNRSAVVMTDAGRDTLIKEALNHYEGLGHDFSQYDNDGDGDIDYFIVMWTGPDTGWGTFWWGYQTSFSDGAYTLDGKTLSKYSWQWESSSPTVVIHETGHALGLPDYYDYDDTVGPDGGVGGFDMMDANQWDHNCFSKWMLEWLTPTVVSGFKQDLTLDPTSESGEAVLIWPGVGLGDMFGEYYMAQNRQDTENDNDGWFNVDGLAIWHIDATLNDAGTGFRYNNSSTAHKLIRLMEADGLEEIEAEPSGGSADGADIYNEDDRFSHVTSPSSAKYDGTDSCVTVCDIIDHGFNAQVSASFSTICSLPPTSDASGPYSAECQGSSTEITLDGTGSSDPDVNDTLSYSWTTDIPGADFDDPTSATPVLIVDSTNGCSINGTVTLTVTDCAGNSDSSSASVTIQDTLPPEISVTLDRTVLWPPGHKMINITATVVVTDTCNENAGFVLTSITSNEPDEGLGDGDTPGDIQGAEFGTPDTDFLLKAERSGTGTGRIYTIVYTASDGCGTDSSHTKTATVYVYVPHDMGKKP